MARRRKYHPHGSVLFATLSIEEGLLLLCTPLCKALIQGCLARAQHLYPIRICHFNTEATHLHLIGVVDDPDHVPAFIRHFKTETAHLLNRLLGRKKRTIWCEGYDSPVVLTPLRALMVIAYTYANPAKDNLEESIDAYPGLSSWQMFREKTLKHSWKWIQRPQVQELPARDQTLIGYTLAAQRVLKDSKQEHTFTLDPDAWLRAFNIPEAEHEEWNSRLIRRIRTLEERFGARRRLKHQRVLGAERLRAQPLDITYRPVRTGRRMWCLTEDRTLRREFIRFFDSISREARAILQRWRRGDFSARFPLGLYPPSFPKLAEPLYVW